MPIKPDLTQPIPAELGAVHCIGIGGSGVSGIARVLLALGHRVTGSDLRESATTRTLVALGATIAFGHRAENLPGDTDTVIITGALWPENPEVVAARDRGIPVIHRSQALVALIGDRRLIAVAGAHGKTTSTGMIVTALREVGAAPSFVNGGVIAAYETSAELGTGPLMVVEADESDGSFLLYSTAIALITNVDDDHLDHYGSVDAVESAFVTFAEAARELVVLSADDPGAIRVRARLRHPHVVTFGESSDADVRIADLVTIPGDPVPMRFTVHVRGVAYPAQLQVVGHHHALNAAGAIAVLDAVGVSVQDSIAGLVRFAGTGRRYELHGEVRGVRVYDDYAHHPAEVAAVLTAARSVVGSGRIIAVHQPHLYSRTRMFAGEFAAVLEACADDTVVLAVCGAREDPEPGVTGQLVSDRFVDPARVTYCDPWPVAALQVARVARSGDIVITLGCGDVYRIIPELLAALGEEPVPEPFP